MKQYEIWWANRAGAGGKRPVLLLSRDSAYQDLNKFIAVEITTTVRGIAEEATLGRADGLSKRCVTNCDNVRTVPRLVLVTKADALAAGRRSEIKVALGYAPGWRELLEVED